MVASHYDVIHNDRYAISTREHTSSCLYRIYTHTHVYIYIRNYIRYIISIILFNNEYP